MSGPKPNDTHVISVGVSTYESAPELPRSRDHAIAFAKWAASRGVPPSQIHLFIDDVKPQRLFENDLTRFDVRRPLLEKWVEFEKALRNLTGQVLYVFWSGHGYTWRSEHRGLCFSGWGPSHYSTLDAYNFLMALRCNLQPGQFRQQIAYIDACANRIEGLRFEVVVSPHRSDLRLIRADVKQTSYFATDLGQQTIAGEFGGKVLDALRAWSAGASSWPDHDAIFQVVRDQYGLDHTQWPVRVERQHEGNLTNFGSPPSADGRITPADVLKSASDISHCLVSWFWDLAGIRIEPVLNDPSLRDTIYERLRSPAEWRNRLDPRPTAASADEDWCQIIASAFRWNREANLGAAVDDLVNFSGVFQIELKRIQLLRDARVLLFAADLAKVQQAYSATIEMLQSAYRPDPVSTKDDMLTDLGQIGFANDASYSYNIIVFLIRLARLVPALADRCSEIIARHDPARVRDQIEAKLNKEKRFVLRIEVDPDRTRPRPARISATLVDEETKVATKLKLEKRPRIKDKALARWDDLADHVDRFVEAARRHVIRDRDRLRVEFILPDFFLDKAPESFKMTCMRSQETLGSLHGVVIRWRDRFHGFASVNERPWKDALSRIKLDELCRLAWLNDKTLAEAHKSCASLAALEFAPQSWEQILDVVLVGLPFIAWYREPPAVPEGWSTYKAALEGWAQNLSLKELAGQARDPRSAPVEVTTGLTLYWDGPDRSPKLSDVRVS